MNTLFQNRINPGRVIEYGELTDLFSESLEIYNRAISENNIYAICLMLSGGDDSVTALQVCRLLGIKIDFVIHGVTGTGLPCVRNYVRQHCEKYGMNLIEADAGDAFERYVRRKGFFGKGIAAHQFSYHLLKYNPFNAAISKYLRKGVAGRKIILLNGVRVEESENRADNFGDNPYRWDKNNLWVNIIHWWTKKNSLTLLESENVERNPASIHLNRSGECNCGTTQSEADRIAASEFDPIWGIWMSELRNEITRKFGWDISGNPSKKLLEEIKASTQNKESFMPMCVGCKSIQQKLQLTI